MTEEILNNQLENTESVNQEEQVVIPFEPRKLEYSLKELYEMNKEHLLQFDISIQRAYKWRDNKANNYKSKLILSILVNMDIGTMHCNCKFSAHEDKVYQFLDGKQRSNTIFDFLDNKFMLKYLPPIEIGIGKNKQVVDINGKVFKELPESLQERITSCKPIIFYYENLTESQKAYVFTSINNGMPLTNAEKDRVEIKDQAKIADMANHRLFDVALSQKQVNNRKDEIIVKHTWAVLNIANVGLTQKLLHPIIKDVDITEDQISEINEIYDKLLLCHNTIAKQAKKEKNKTKAKKIVSLSKKFLKLNHIPSIAPVIKKSIEDNVSVDVLTDWITHFFDAQKATISIDYNLYVTSGTGAPKSVKGRIDAAMDDYNEFIANYNKHKHDNEQMQID